MEKKLRKAYVYRLEPTPEQITSFLNYSQATRFVFNWALAQIKEQFDKPKVEGEPKQKLVNYYDFCRELTQIKKQEQYAWLSQTACHTLQSAFRNLDEAMKHFFRRIKLKEKPGFPKFKSRYRDNSFRFPDEVPVRHVSDTHIYLPKIGYVAYTRGKYYDKRPLEGIIKTMTIKQEGKHWFIMLSCVITKTVIPAPEDRTVALELGITKQDYSTFLLSSDGKDAKSPNYYQAQMTRLGNIQQSLARKPLDKEKDNKNRTDCQNRLAKMHLKIKRKRKDFLHKLSATIVKNNDVIIVKDLPIKEMMKDEQFALALGDAGWHSFVLMLKNKCEWYGKHFREV